ncbi:hydrolase [Aquimarina sp. MMG016]|uniref:hydrolase n=1 Tax=Aquimarina sp. MMG016 TaxID=2822690 RepID=UPI001B3A2211|nr:hydrolase [Aquimarina sp. MMG016]MBQ4819689.1 hypothetical protein [Aquimarina sp. MMG016]
MNAIQKKDNGECCPEFSIEKWDEKTFDWNKKPFIKSSVPAIFHVPFFKKLGKKITQMMQKAEDAHSISENKEDILLLFNDPHPFRSDMYLSVDDEVAKARNVHLSGEFMTKVFDGHPKDMPKYIKKMNIYLESQHKKAKDYYVHYAYCPKCAKSKGHNYMVLFAEV